MIEVDSYDFNVKVFLLEGQKPVVIPDTITVTVGLTYPQGVHLDKSAILDHLLRNPDVRNIPPFRLIRMNQEIFSSDDPNVVHEILHYELEPQFPGQYVLTPMSIPFFTHASTDLLKNILSPVVFVDVVLPEMTVMDFTTEIAPLANLTQREPIELDASTRAYVMRDHSALNSHLFQNKNVHWQLMGVGFLFLLMTWFVKIVLSHKKIITAAISQQKMALIEAEGMLVSLRGQPSPQPSLVEVFIIELTNSVRYYFEEHFHVQAPKKTTQEMVQELQNHLEIPQEKKEAILIFLQTTDRIKFAGYQPSYEECLQAYNKAKDIMLNK